MAQFPALVQSIENPGQPTAVPLKEGYPEIGKAFQYTAGAKASYGQHQFNGVAVGVDKNTVIGMSPETAGYLFMIGIRCGVKADWHTQSFGLTPQRVKIMIMNVSAIDRFRNQGKTHGAQVIDRTAGLVHG